MKKKEHSKTTKRTFKFIHLVILFFIVTISLAFIPKRKNEIKQGYVFDAFCNLCFITETGKIVRLI